MGIHDDKVLADIANAMKIFNEPSGYNPPTKDKIIVNESINFISNNSVVEELELKNGIRVCYRILNQENMISLVNEIVRLNKKCNYLSSKYIELKDKYEPSTEQEIF